MSRFDHHTIVAQQANHRLAFLDEFDRLLSHPDTLEAEVHRAIENNLWLLGNAYRLITSNKSLAKLIDGLSDAEYTGADGNRRPDLFLVALDQQTYLLIEFKRPSHRITRDDENQANKYRDALQHSVPGKKIQVLLIGGGRDPKISSPLCTSSRRHAHGPEIRVYRARVRSQSPSPRGARGVRRLRPNFRQGSVEPRARSGRQMPQGSYPFETANAAHLR